MIVLTGGSGFLGETLLCALANENVRCLGRQKPSRMSESSFYQSEINAHANFTEVVKGANVVIHCAARVHIMNDQSSNTLEKFREVNTYGTLNLAQQAANAGVKRFIFISSVKVNGESTEFGLPFKHDTNFVPSDPYSLSKYEAEIGLNNIAKNTCMEVVIIRPPLVYGEGVKANFASLMKLVGKGYPLPFRSINRNKRSLVSVYNLVDLIKVCIDHPEAANQAFLVSDDDDLSTAQMVALMAKVQGKVNLSLPVPVWCFKLAGKLFKNEAVIDRLVGSLQLDIEFTKKTLNWTPPYSVEHGFTLAAKTRQIANIVNTR